MRIAAKGDEGDKEGEANLKSRRDSLCAEICREDKRTALDASLLAQTRIKSDRLKFSDPYNR